MEYDFLRNADVSVTVSHDKRKHPTATINVNDKYEHTFNTHSRISKHLDNISPEDLSERLTGGSYFFVGDDLYDFRDGQYNGFTQTDDTVSHLYDLLGITSEPRGVRVHENVAAPNITLGCKWSDHAIEIPGFKDGGAFSSELHFSWSPFVKTVNSAFMLYRLICANGMRGMRSFMNTRIPLVNRWEEHLEIANRQIQNKVSAIAQRRFADMGDERVSVGELLLIEKHVKNRLEHKGIVHSERTTLSNLRHVVSPRAHLSGVYKDSVFNDNAIAAQHLGHLTVLDVYNIVTELRSHTTPAANSSSRALDYIANDMLFDRKDRMRYVDINSAPKKCVFSDPDAAFFGDMS